jgi:DNA-binding transcriptional LysR family regulator
MDQRAATELLPALCALLETESVTLAARRMRVGQPAMSRTLEKLRETTRDALLVREGRRMVRTRRAEAMLPKVQALLATAMDVLGPPAPFVPASATGVVTVALGDDMQAVLTGPLLETIRARAPGLDVRVRALSFQSAEDAVRGRVDLAVLPDMRKDFAIPSLGELVMQPQYTRRFVVASRRRRTFSLEAFIAAEHVLVAPTGEGGGYVDDALEALGRARRVAVAVPSFQAAITLVRGSDLVATLPHDVVRALAPSLHVTPCPVTTPELPICVGWAARFTHDTRHKWLRTQVVEALRVVGRARRR